MLYAFLIAFISAVGGFLFGYDLAIIGGANVFLKEQFHLSDTMFGFTSASAGLGCMIGPLLGARLCDRLGRRNTLLAACFLLAVGSIFTAVPRDMITFNAFRIVGGIGVGLCSIASPIYTNEIAPCAVAGRIGTHVPVGDRYRLDPGRVGGLASGPLAPGRNKLALDVRLGTRVRGRFRLPAGDGAGESAMAGRTRPLGEGPGGLRADRRRGVRRVRIGRHSRVALHGAGHLEGAFGPGLRMALVVGLCLAFFNNSTGWTGMCAYLAYLFEAAGFRRSDAIFQFLLAYGFMGLMTLAACFLVDRVGRRPLWLVSSLVMVAANVLMGLVFHLQITGPLVLAAVFLCAIPHSFALGSLPWLMMSEIFPTRIRARAVAITTSFIWPVCFLAQYFFPVIAGLSKRIVGSIGGVFWFSAAICVLAFLFGLWLLPETKGRTLEEIAESWKTNRTRDPRGDSSPHTHL